jgi:hypothetical protein
MRILNNIGMFLFILGLLVAMSAAEAQELFWVALIGMQGCLLMVAGGLMATWRSLGIFFALTAVALLVAAALR